ncbi:oligosaccharide flippase family protein [Metasolibacillus meyeri]|uniref:Oligosaccharide flippase family protein n=1 Tax=Metasolibacillus meyeri TaxID=1071052 RepID=A0AAW9NU54_9BACL|nr:oligosaccharide flippase family protein [Metasolibacillus meyeri]MEC1177743.1 oligosaccharide flippase family protein [Metasolibacillus meyeri]
MYKKLMVLFSGAIFAQMVPLITMPFITRLFTPEEIGLYSLYLTLVSISFIFTTLRLELAIPIMSIEKLLKDMGSIVIVNGVGATIFALVVGFIDLKFNVFEGYSPLVICAAFFLSINSIGIYQVLYQYGIREGQYKKLSTNKVILQINIAIFSLLFGVFFQNYLLLALVIASVLCSIILKRKLKLKFNLTNISLEDIKNTIYNFRAFPYYQLPNQLLGALSSNSILITVSIFYSSKELGFYSLTERILRSPISLLGSGSADLFKNMAAKEIEETGTCKKSYKKIMLFNVITGIPIFFGLYVIMDTLILYLFGENWMKVAEYAKILIPSLFGIYVVFPVNYLFIVYKRQRTELNIQLFQFVVTFCIVIWAVIKKLNVESLLVLYSVISFIMSVIIGLTGLLIIKLKRGIEE